MAASAAPTPSRMASTCSAGTGILESRPSRAASRLESGESWATLRSSAKSTCHLEKSMSERSARGARLFTRLPPDRATVKAPCALIAAADACGG